MEDWAERCRRLAREYARLLPAGMGAEALAEKAAEFKNSDDLYVLQEVSPRLRAVGDTECIYEDDSYAEFARPFAQLAEEALGPIEIVSRYDGRAEKAYVAFKARGREHSIELEQSLDYADLDGVLTGLNRLLGPASPRRFFYIDRNDGFVGFLSEADADLLRKKGYRLRRDGRVVAEPPPKPTRRAATAGVLGLSALGAVFVLKTYLGIARARTSRKDDRPRGIPLPPGEIFTGREFLDPPGRLSLEVRAYGGPLKASFATYDFRIDGALEAAAERLRRSGVEIPAGSVGRIEMTGEGALVWGVWNDGPAAARFEVRTLSD